MPKNLSQKVIALLSEICLNEPYLSSMRKFINYLEVSASNLNYKYTTSQLLSSTTSSFALCYEASEPPPSDSLTCIKGKEFEAGLDSFTVEDNSAENAGNGGNAKIVFTYVCSDAVYCRNRQYAAKSFDFFYYASILLNFLRFMAKNNLFLTEDKSQADRSVSFFTQTTWPTPEGADNALKKINEFFDEHVRPKTYGQPFDLSSSRSVELVDGSSPKKFRLSFRFQEPLNFLEEFFQEKELVEIARLAEEESRINDQNEWKSNFLRIISTYLVTEKLKGQTCGREDLSGAKHQFFITFLEPNLEFELLLNRANVLFGKGGDLFTYEKEILKKELFNSVAYTITVTSWSLVPEELKAAVNGMNVKPMKSGELISGMFCCVSEELEQQLQAVVSEEDASVKRLPVEERGGNQEIAALEKVIRQMREEMRRLKKEQERWSSSPAATAETLIETLRHQLNALAEENKKLRSQHAVNTSSPSDSTGPCDSKQEGGNFEVLLQTLSSLTEANKKKDKEVADLRERINDLEKRIKELLEQTTVVATATIAAVQPADTCLEDTSASQNEERAKKYFEKIENFKDAIRLSSISHLLILDEQRGVERKIWQNRFKVDLLRKLLTCLFEKGSDHLINLENLPAQIQEATKASQEYRKTTKLLSAREEFQNFLRGLNAEGFKKQASARLEKVKREKQAKQGALRKALARIQGGGDSELERRPPSVVSSAGKDDVPPNFFPEDKLPMDVQDTYYLRVNDRGVGEEQTYSDVFGLINAEIERLKSSLAGLKQQCDSYKTLAKALASKETLDDVLRQLALDPSVDKTRLSEDWFLSMVEELTLILNEGQASFAMDDERDSDKPVSLFTRIQRYYDELMDVLLFKKEFAKTKVGLLQSNKNMQNIHQHLCHNLRGTEDEREKLTENERRCLGYLALDLRTFAEVLNNRPHCITVGFADKFAATRHSAVFMLSYDLLSKLNQSLSGYLCSQRKARKLCLYELPPTSDEVLCITDLDESRINFDEEDIADLLFPDEQNSPPILFVVLDASLDELTEKFPDLKVTSVICSGIELFSPMFATKHFKAVKGGLSSTAEATPAAPASLAAPPSMLFSSDQAFGGAAESADSFGVQAEHK